MLKINKTENFRVNDSNDIVLARQSVRRHAAEMGFSLVDQTKLVTATSELARNMVDYGGGGNICIQQLTNNSQGGLRVTFEDHGPGIPDMALAMQEGFTTGNGLGQGLPGARRLVDEFEIDSTVGKGTRVVITRWNRNYEVT